VSSEEELSLADELPSLLDAPEDDAGGVVSAGFMDTRIDAASRS